MLPIYMVWRSNIELAILDLLQQCVWTVISVQKELEASRISYFANNPTSVGLSPAKLRFPDESVLAFQTR